MRPHNPTPLRVFSAPSASLRPSSFPHTPPNPRTAPAQNEPTAARKCSEMFHSRNAHIAPAQNEPTATLNCSRMFHPQDAHRAPAQNEPNPPPLFPTPSQPITCSPMSDAALPHHAPKDPALDQSMPEVPLLAEERAPLRPSLLDFNPARRHMENLDTLRIIAMLVIILTHVT